MSRQGGVPEMNAMNGDRGMSIAPTTSPLLHKPEPVDLRLILLTSLGGAMEFYDFTLFAFLATTLAKAFIPPVAPTWLGTFEALGVFAAAYLARPLGGLVLANFGDVFGRRHIFLFSIGLMTFATFCVACMPTYETIGIAAPILLIVLRCLQGIAIGGEVPGSWTFISEHVAAERRGLACGIICSGLSSGILLGCGTALLFETFTDTAWFEREGWRYPFILGGALGLIAMAARRSLQETPVFHETRGKPALIPHLPLEVVVRDFRLNMTICIALMWLIAATLVMTTMLNVSYLHRFVGYSTYDALLATGCCALALTIATWPVGLLVDRYGPGPVIMIGSVILAVSAMLFYGYADRSRMHLLLLNSLLGASVGVCGAVPYVLVNAFPAQVRYTGVSLCYNIPLAVFGGLTPFGVNWLMQYEPMSYAYYLVVLCCIAFLAGLHLFLYGLKAEMPQVRK
jgi:MFS family permease